MKLDVTQCLAYIVANKRWRLIHSVFVWIMNLVARSERKGRSMMMGLCVELLIKAKFLFRGASGSQYRLITNSCDSSQRQYACSRLRNNCIYTQLYSDTLTHIIPTTHTTQTKYQEHNFIRWRLKRQMENLRWYCVESCIFWPNFI